MHIILNSIFFFFLVKGGWSGRCKGNDQEIDRTRHNRDDVVCKRDELGSAKC